MSQTILSTGTVRGILLPTITHPSLPAGTRLLSQYGDHAPGREAPQCHDRS